MFPMESVITFSKKLLVVPGGDSNIKWPNQRPSSMSRSNPMKCCLIFCLIVKF